MSEAKSSQKVSAGQHAHRRLAFALVGVVILGIMLALNWKTQPAMANSPSCGIAEITFTSAADANQLPIISGDGKWIVFESTQDLTGGNADGNLEVFLYDTTAATFTQVTNTTGGPNQNASINADGTRIAFQSDRDLVPGGNDGSTQIFLYDTRTNTFTQITRASGGLNVSPSINGDGTRIAFWSDRDLVPGGNDGLPQIFLYDTTTNSFTQVTRIGAAGTIFEHSIKISGDGTRIVFSSTRDLVTGGNVDGTAEIFLYDTRTNSFTQVTSTLRTINHEPSTSDPSINADGTRIAFFSDAFSGGNPDGNKEIFLYDATTGGISEITFTTDVLQLNIRPSINADGTRIAFVSDHDLTGGNADGNFEVFLYDTNTNSFTQITDTGGGNPAPDASISGDGTRVAFSSNRFANLGNADGNNEIFLASCILPPPPAQADLLLSQSADKTSVKQGDMLTYTVTVKNFGPDSAANVLINDTLSSGATFVSAHANKGRFTAPPAGQTGTVTWYIGTVSNGEQDAAQIQVTVIIRGKATITNTATVNSDAQDPNPANNSTALSTTVERSSGGSKK